MVMLFYDQPDTFRIGMGYCEIMQFSCPDEEEISLFHRIRSTARLDNAMSFGDQPRLIIVVGMDGIAGVFVIIGGWAGQY